MSDVAVKGLAELQAFLDQLPKKMEANVMRGALRAGANVVKDAAKSNVPVHTGLLREGIKVSTRSRRGVVTASVKATGKHAYVAKWMEYGTAAHEIVAKKGGSLFLGGFFAHAVNHPGARPHPFMRPALDTQATAAVTAVGEYVKARLDKNGFDVAEIEIGET